MSQSRRQSLAETCMNTGVGMVGSFNITLACAMWIEDKLLMTTATVLLCTVWSVARGYCIRRFYNGKKEQTEETSLRNLAVMCLCIIAVVMAAGAAYWPYK